VASEDHWPRAKPPPANSDSPDFGKYARDFGMADYQADPGYSFRLAEGLKALQRTAAARGGLLSGAILKGVTRYGQDSASQEYQNAFNRYQVNRANQLQPLQSLMGAGQTATNTVGAAGQIYAGQAGEAMMGGANARGSGYVGVANAINSGLGSYLNHQQNQNYMNLLKPGGTGSPGSGSSWLSQPTYGDGLEYGGP